jgi:hypothetical protein
LQDHGGNSASEDGDMQGWAGTQQQQQQQQQQQAAIEEGGGGAGSETEEEEEDVDDDDGTDQSDEAVARRLQREERRHARRRQRQSARDAAEAQRLGAHEARKQRRRAELKAAQDGGRDVLHEVRASLGDFLRDKGGCLAVVGEPAPNPHAAAGQPLYEAFLQAWVESNMAVRLVFHGTAEANVDAICAAGLDPKFRRGQAYGKGEYFADDALVSIPYCKGGKAMLVFAVLTDPSGMTYDQGGIVVVHKPEHQLPLFVVRFEYNHAAAAGRQQGGRSGHLYAQGQAIIAAAARAGGGVLPAGAYGGAASTYAAMGAAFASAQAQAQAAVAAMASFRAPRAARKVTRRKPKRSKK